MSDAPDRTQAARFATPKPKPGSAMPEKEAHDVFLSHRYSDRKATTNA